MIQIVLLLLSVVAATVLMLVAHDRKRRQSLIPIRVASGREAGRRRRGR